MKIRPANVVGGIHLLTVLFLIVVVWLLTTGCATANARAQTAAVVQKTAVDGIGGAYLDYCTIVRSPKCVAADEDAKAAGTPQTKEQRIACLRPCDSSTAEKVMVLVDLVLVAQTALFHTLKSDPSEAELDASRAQLEHAVNVLFTLMREEGILELLGDALGR